MPGRTGGRNSVWVYVTQGRCRSVACFFRASFALSCVLHGTLVPRRFTSPTAEATHAMRRTWLFVLVIALCPILALVGWRFAGAQTNKTATDVQSQASKKLPITQVV